MQELNWDILNSLGEGEGERAREYHQNLQPPSELSFMRYLATVLKEHPQEVCCEVCVGSYVIDTFCPGAEPDDPEQPHMWHVTIQRAHRPWNNLPDGMSLSTRDARVAGLSKLAP